MDDPHQPDRCGTQFFFCLQCRRHPTDINQAEDISGQKSTPAGATFLVSLTPKTEIQHAPFWSHSLGYKLPFAYGYQLEPARVYMSLTESLHGLKPFCYTLSWLW